MLRFTVIEADRVPPGFPESGPAFLNTSPEEYRELVARGVWVESGAGNWTRVAPDGSVWAGGTAGRVAKIRGKAGRKLGCGRSPVPAEERRRTRSLQLSPVAVRKLSKLAQAQTEATGQRVTVSMVVENWAQNLAV